VNARRILVAYDGSEEARRALLQAAIVASTKGASIGVVTVMPAAIVPPLQAAAVEAVGVLREHKLEATLHTPTGDPATEILRTAHDGAYDTVFVGRRPDCSLARMLLGSVSQAVARAFRRTVVTW
jgi:nucleotide-binding universal stress UspA family protein